jgi:prepilin-type N-terminal cleavage/methylation domain-containing protein
MGRRPEVDARGFTLLELIVTLFVIALAVAIVGPAIGRGTDTLRVRAEVSGFASFFRHAREQAITRREPLRVVVEPAEHRVTLLGPAGAARRSRLFAAGLVIDATAPADLTVRFEPEGGSSGARFRLADAGIAYRVTVDALTGRVRSERE